MKLSTEVLSAALLDYGSSQTVREILSAIIVHREENNLDEKSSPDSLQNVPLEEVVYEIDKLITIFSLMRKWSKPRDEISILEVIGEKYPMAEILEIVQEYFPHVLPAARN